MCCYCRQYTPAVQPQRCAASRRTMGFTVEFCSLNNAANSRRTNIGNSGERGTTTTSNDGPITKLSHRVPTDMQLPPCLGCRRGLAANYDILVIPNIRYNTMGHSNPTYFSTVVFVVGPSVTADASLSFKQPTTLSYYDTQFV